MQQEQQAWREEVEVRAKAQSDLALERMARQMDGRVADVQREAACRTAELQTQVVLFCDLNGCGVLVHAKLKHSLPARPALLLLVRSTAFFPGASHLQLAAEQSTLPCSLLFQTIFLTELQLQSCKGFSAARLILWSSCSVIMLQMIDARKCAAAIISDSAT